MYLGKQINMMTAMDVRCLIGNDNDLPWPKITEDMVYFRNTTTPHPIIYGRKTFDSFGKRILKNRQNIILSRNESLVVPEDAVLATDFENAVSKASSDTVFVIGGAEIYKLALPHADNLYITHIHKMFKGNVYFPTFDVRDWRLETSKGLIVGPPNEKFTIKFCVYSRIQNPTLS